MVVVTTKQLETLRAIDELTRERGFAPTLRELSAAMGVRSLSSTVGKVDKLAIKGLVVSDQRRRRSLRLTAAGVALLVCPEMAVVDDRNYPQWLREGRQPPVGHKVQSSDREAA